MNTQEREVVELTPDWTVELSPPECDLTYSGCQRTAWAGIRVHNCAFHYVCRPCAAVFQRRVRMSNKEFSELSCRTCKRRYDRADYYTIIKL